MSQEQSAVASRAITLSVVSHCVALLGVAIPTIVLHSGIDPFPRDFFCDDESISYPFKTNTVPFYTAVGVGIAVAIVTVLVVEAIRVAAEQDPTKGTLTEALNRCMAPRSAGYFLGVLTGFYMLLFGALCTELVTQTGKLGFGRHRPHFLAICQLNGTCRAGQRYQISDCSASIKASVLNEAHVSFPSGHSSFSMFIGTFLALYLQGRLAFCHEMHALKNLVQFAFLLLAGYVCMSRVSDYHHHWSDILGGALIGVLLAILTAVSLFIHRVQPYPLLVRGPNYEMVSAKTRPSESDTP